MREQLVYIARALDGSWVAPQPAATEEDARAQIAAREPDENKRSAYQILIEPMSKLLADQIPGIRRGIKQRLVKWDGDAPIPDDAADNPSRYPQISEVLEGGDGVSTPKVIYRRS